MKETRNERRARMVAVYKDTMAMIKESRELTHAVKESKLGTKFYSIEPLEKPNTSCSKETVVTVSGNRSFEAAVGLKARHPDKRVAVLNFASATSPGGGVKSGSSAQEESLCRCSTLYPLLNRKLLREKYYTYNREQNNTLSTDACIYTPGVKIIKSDTDQPERLPESDWVDVDVITCAAPSFRHATPLDDDALYQLHLKRGRQILNVALANGVDCLVLGAFGCGAFRNDPKVVASVYKQLMEEYRGAFDEVEFAVFYWGKEVENYEVFKSVLG
jgi:uncharacterized protein (TIGR02452 family)